MLKKTLFATAAVALVATSAHAQDVFRVGILGGENEADRLRNNQCLIDLLPEAIGVKEVQLFPAADYEGVVQGLLGGTLDYAELGASAYAKVYLEDPEAVDPVLTTQQVDGATGYYSIMLARKDSGIESIEDARGKRLGFADPDSTSGFLVPMTFVFSARDIDPKSCFRNVTNANHETNAMAVAKGQLDAAANNTD